MVGAPPCISKRHLAVDEAPWAAKISNSAPAQRGLQAHLAGPLGAQPRKGRPRERPLPGRHVDQVCAQRCSAVRVGARHAEVHPPALAELCSSTKQMPCCSVTSRFSAALRCNQIHSTIDCATHRVPRTTEADVTRCAPEDIIGVPQLSVRRRAAIRTGQAAIEVAAALARVALVCG